MAQAFDAEHLHLSGDPFPVAELAAGGENRAVLGLRERDAGFHRWLGERRTIELVRSERQAARTGWTTSGEENPSLSPDGRTIAFDRGSPHDIWLLDVDRGGATRVISERSDDRQAVWSPDGKTLAFSSTAADPRYL